MRTYLEVISEVGRGCGSTAWVASLINVCAWLASLFPDRAQRDVWGTNPDAWIAGAGTDGAAGAWVKATVWKTDINAAAVNRRRWPCHAIIDPMVDRQPFRFAAEKAT